MPEGLGFLVGEGGPAGENNGLLPRPRPVKPFGVGVNRELDIVDLVGVLKVLARRGRGGVLGAAKSGDSDLEREGGGEDGGNVSSSADAMTGKSPLQAVTGGGVDSSVCSDDVALFRLRFSLGGSLSICCLLASAFFSSASSSSVAFLVDSRGSVAVFVRAHSGTTYCFRAFFCAALRTGDDAETLGPWGESGTSIG